MISERTPSLLSIQSAISFNYNPDELVWGGGMGSNGHMHFRRLPTLQKWSPDEKVPFPSLQKLGVNRNRDTCR